MPLHTIEIALHFFILNKLEEIIFIELLIEYFQIESEHHAVKSSPFILQIEVDFF